MGAAAVWCQEALQGNYTTNPLEGTSLRKVKKIASAYTYAVNPGGEIKQFLKKQLNVMLKPHRQVKGSSQKWFVGKRSGGIDGESKKGASKQGAMDRIIKSHLLHMTDMGHTAPLRHMERMQAQHDPKEKMKLVLDAANISSASTYVASTLNNDVVFHVTHNHGVYLMLCGMHYMAVVSRTVKPHYFYDNMNGLYECPTDALFKIIARSIRTKEDDWAQEWYCRKCGTYPARE